MKKIPLPVAMLSVNFGLIWVAMCPALNPWLVDGMLFHPYTEIDSNALATIERVRGCGAEVDVCVTAEFGAQLRDGRGC